MKKLNVYLQYPIFKSDSQYYKSILDNPPSNVNYIPSIQSAGMITSKKEFKKIKILKKIIRFVFNKTHLPFPSAFYVKNSSRYDLIHCAHCLCLNRSPWVADIEHPFQMWGGAELTRLRKYFVKKLLMSKHCKKIMPWTEEAKRDILKDFPEVESKIELLSFAMPMSSYISRKNKNEINLLFIGRYFFQKGGLDAVEALDILTKKYKNVKATFISETPDYVLEKYSKNEKIFFSNLIPFEKIMKDVYPKTDIYICPGYTDSLGFPFVEAQSYGIPVITVDGYSRKEVVLDGETGFVIPSNKNVDYNKINRGIVKNIVDKASLLIEDKKLRNNMSVAGKNAVGTGKFSLEKRNNLLKRIYGEAIQ